MSKIQDKINELLTKKKKIDYISYVLDLVKNDTKCIDFKDVQQDVVNKLEPFLKELSEAIESDTTVKTSVEAPQFANEEVQVLKLLASKALEKKPQPQTQTPNNSFTQEIPPPAKPVQAPSHEMSPHEKMNFALSNRHLANKEVSILNDKSEIIETGIVVAIDAPNILVKTKTGPTIAVPLPKLVMS